MIDKGSVKSTFTARARAVQAAARLERLRGKEVGVDELWTRLTLFVGAIFRGKTPDDLTEEQWIETKRRLDELETKIRRHIGK
jgi:hypothetical protein